MMKKSLFRAHPLTLSLLAMSTASAYAADKGASDETAVEPTSVRWGLGVAVNIRKSIYDGVGTRSMALPLVRYDGDVVHVSGNQIDVTAPSVGAVKFSLHAELPVGEGYKSVDSPQLAGMADRRSAVMVGVNSTLQCELADLMLAWLKSASGGSHGSAARFGAEHAFRMAPMTQLVPHVAVSSFDRRYVDYFYGVTAAEATSIRPFYAGKSARAFEFGVRLQHAIDLRHRFQVDVSNTRYGDGITASPIVAKSLEATVKVGYSYSF